jgi:hypothetical protein
MYNKRETEKIIGQHEANGKYAMLDVEHFTKPLLMLPFEKPVLGEAELALLTPLTFPLMMKYAGVEKYGCNEP